jgi:hypothetical protein
MLVASTAADAFRMVRRLSVWLSAFLSGLMIDIIPSFKNGWPVPDGILM